MDAKTRKKLKRIAHHLDPVISVGDHGLSANVLAETDRALRDHELIKVKLHTADRDDRASLSNELATQCSAAIVQKIGKVIVLFRANPDPKPALSNLSRYASTR
jgi:RNA-binding protein